jgi:hypothetical protein
MGYYYGFDVVFISVIVSMFLAFFGALAGWGVANCGAALGKTVMDNRDGGWGLATAIAGVVLFILVCFTHYTLPLAIMVIAFFVPALISIILSDVYYKRHVPKWISAADELANLGGAIIDVLDEDGDGVVSKSDVKARRTMALTRGVSADLLDQLANSMNEYGHNVGTESSSCYVLGAKDIPLAPTRVRDKYKGDWAEVYIQSHIALKE